MEGESTESIIKTSIYVQEINLNSCFFVKDKGYRHKNYFQY